MFFSNLSVTTEAVASPHLEINSSMTCTINISLCQPSTTCSTSLLRRKGEETCKIRQDQLLLSFQFSTQNLNLCLIFALNFRSIITICPKLMACDVASVQCYDVPTLHMILVAYSMGPRDTC